MKPLVAIQQDRLPHRLADACIEMLHAFDVAGLLISDWNTRRRLCSGERSRSVRRSSKMAPNWRVTGNVGPFEVRIGEASSAPTRLVDLMAETDVAG